ncbi:MAG: dimethyl sulfoxide reductase anchor subunit [Proteobacteria bacterium]|nr:dimethyl sulfoxide reductase anchor subunit [Pseudomonadota bacterium]
MNNMELSLVFFTVLSQVAVGICVLSAYRRWSTSNGNSDLMPDREWMAVGALFLVAVIASFFHLGHPSGGPRAILNLKTAWLSREVLFVLLFGAGVGLSYLAVVRKLAISQILISLTALLGIALVVSTGMVYSNTGYPALNNLVPVFYGLFTACVLGIAFSSYFSDEKQEPFLVKALFVSLLIGLVVNLMIPSIWLSGGKAMQLSGAAYYGSVLYWLQMIGEFGLGLFVIGIARKIPIWLPPILLIGELIGRITMYSQTVHASIQIGGL